MASVDTPCHKGDEETAKENYRPISSLPCLSKILKRVLYDQINYFFQNIFFKHLVSTLLMDLSKVYDFLDHDLILAKLEAYNFNFQSLQLIESYLKYRKQRVRVGSESSLWLDIIRGVPQGSILGPIIFNIFINDIFLYITETDICNYADDNSLYACDSSLEMTLVRLQNDLIQVMNWFDINSLVVNEKKSQLMVLGNIKSNEVSMKVKDKYN